MSIEKFKKIPITPVLPTVYREELSYMEVLGKTLDKLNEVIDEVNDIDLAPIYADLSDLSNALETAEGDIDDLEYNVGGLMEQMQGFSDALATKQSIIERTYTGAGKVVVTDSTNGLTDSNVALSDLASKKYLHIVTVKELSSNVEMHTSTIKVITERNTSINSVGELVSQVTGSMGSDGCWFANEKWEKSATTNYIVASVLVDSSGVKMRYVSAGESGIALQDSSYLSTPQTCSVTEWVRYQV